MDVARSGPKRYRVLENAGCFFSRNMWKYVVECAIVAINKTKTRQKRVCLTQCDSLNDGFAKSLFEPVV